MAVIMQFLLTMIFPRRRDLPRRDRTGGTGVQRSDLHRGHPVDLSGVLHPVHRRSARYEVSVTRRRREDSE